MPEIEIGRVTHYFGHINVAALELTAAMNVGDRIRIVGHTTDLEEKIDSMQLEHQSITAAKAGDAIGIRVQDRVRPHDKVFKIVPEGGKPVL